MLLDNSVDKDTVEDGNADDDNAGLLELSVGTDDDDKAVDVAASADDDDTDAELDGELSG